MTKDLQELFIKKGLTLSLAESCTGGLVSHLITTIPGASNYFLGSVVAYNNGLKASLLGVDRVLLQEKGAVSKEVAIEMCLGIKRVTGSSHAAAITGIAGPSGATVEKPVGTVWIAVDDQAHHYLFQGSREEIIGQAAQEVVRLLCKACST